MILSVGGILGGVFGALAFIALIIVGYIFVLPRIRQARFESKIFEEDSQSFHSNSRALRAESQALAPLQMGSIINPTYSSDA